MSTINTRIQHKIDTAENWVKATNFYPLKGEIIIYSDLNKIKIGDGNTSVINLPFVKMDGPAIYSGTTVPDNNIGEPGDLYIMYAE